MIIAAAALVVTIATTWRNELADLFRLVLVAVKLAPPPAHALAVDVGPFRLDEFRWPRPDNLWVFHQFTVRVQHPAPNAFDNLRAEITSMEPHRPLGASLPLPLRVHRAGIHEAIVDVVRVNVNWLDTGPIQWCGKSLVLPSG